MEDCFHLLKHFKSSLEIFHMTSAKKGGGKTIDLLGNQATSCDGVTLGGITVVQECFDEGGIKFWHSSSSSIY